MEAPGTVNIVSRAIVNSFGTVFNIILIYMVFSKTTKPLRTYSILVFTIAVYDLIACASSLLHNERIIPIGKSNFLISYGACCKLGSLACSVTYNVWLHCYSYTFYILLLSFFYRYYVLLKPAPRGRTIFVITLLVYIPSLLQLLLERLHDMKAIDNQIVGTILGHSVDTDRPIDKQASSFICKRSQAFATLGMDTTEKARQKFIEISSYTDLTNACVSANSNILEWKSLYVALHLTVPVLPVFTAMLIIRRKIVVKLRSESTISEKTRHMHSQLLKALSFHACLALSYLVTLIIYGTGFVTTNYPLLQYSYTFSALVPVLSPLLSLYFIKPYWDHISRIWKSKGIAASSTTVSATDVVNIHF